MHPRIIIDLPRQMNGGENETDVELLHFETVFLKIEQQHVHQKTKVHGEN